MNIVMTVLEGHLELEPVKYEIVEAAPPRFWRAATYYVSSGYGRMGPMSLDAAKRTVKTIKDTTPL